FFQATLEHIAAMLEQAGPVDAIYVANHGAMVSTGTSDPDGEMLARLRAVAGPDAAIVATLDLHGNVSDRMVDSTDLLVAYQTNPHVDMYERGEEAAHGMRAILAGNATPRAAFIRLPLTPASVTLLTREGPYADMIDYGQRRKREMGGAILNVSILGGFVFSDTPENGVAIIVTGRHELAPARALALEIAQMGWRYRTRFRRELSTVDEAVALAVANGEDAARSALIYSDAGDNPGGGGTGRTTELLDALLRGGARGVYYGSFFDAALAHEAAELGEGATFNAVFNRDAEGEHAPALGASATVLRVNQEPFVGRRGIYAERTIEAEPTCALELGGPGGIVVVVISARYQTADPMFFEHLGLDIAEARTVCVKSRGHFRAGFDPWFTPERVYEVDTAGFTSPVLSRFDFKGLPRPCYPLDEDARWSPPDWCQALI
ncbi:MAG: M81 family metallopeptidase, partial [Gammaproteobacteria bacterium]